jgi:MFS family permease
MEETKFAKQETSTEVIEKSQRSMRSEISKALLLIALFEAIITVGWLAYEEYQPVILQKYGFATLASVLIIAQGVLGALLHPISGTIADRLMRKNASKFGIILAGGTFAALVFLTVAIILLNQPGTGITKALPFMVILWLAAMSLFHSPAVSLIDHFVPAERFPQAAAKLTIAFGLIYALEPLVVPILDAIGLTATFVLGGVLVMVGVLAIRSIASFPLKTKSEQESAVVSSGTLFYLFAVGVLVGTGQALLFYYVPNKVDIAAIQAAIPFINSGEVYLSLLLLFAALTSLPIAQVVKRYGEQKTYIVAFLLSILWALVAGNPLPVWMYMLLAIAGGATYAALHIALLTRALHKAPGGNSGRGIGFAFGGVALASAAILLVAYLNGLYWS